MKNQFLKILLLCLVLASCGNQDKKAVSTTDTKPTKEESSTISIDSLSQIKPLYNKIAQQRLTKSLDSNAVTYDCNGEKSGTIKFFYQDKNLVMVEHTDGEYSHTEGLTQFFINKENPFFVYHKNTNWTFEENAAAEGATVDDVTETRSYLADGTVQQCLQKKYRLRSADKANFNPSSIKNKAVACQKPEEILSSYHKLLQYQAQKGKVDCL